MRRPIVPVGASTLACEFRTPYARPISTALSHASCAADESSVGTSSSSMFAASSRCIRKTPSIGSRLSWNPANGPIREAILADVA